MAGLSACGGLEQQFLGVRVQDTCDGAWPVCDSTVGCLVGDRSYVEGRFPGVARVAVRLAEPSTVTVSMLLSQIAGAGEETVVHFYEDRCRARIRQALTGRAFVGEADAAGYVSREADLTGVGDHLVEVTSDARLHYLLKIDVTPLRLKTASASP